MVAFRERVRREVFKGQDAKGAHRTGSGKAAVAILGYAAAACGAYLFDTGLTTGFLLGKPACMAALPPAAQVQGVPCCHASQTLKLKCKALPINVCALLILSPFSMDLAIYTSCARGPFMLCLVAVGLAGAWIGLTVQHCGNHGAMSTSPVVNKAMGLTDDLIGGSSLMWRYHHQVGICSQCLCTYSLCCRFRQQHAS